MVFCVGLFSRKYLLKKTVNYSKQFINKRLELSSCTHDDLKFFNSILGPNNVKCDNLDFYNIDFMKWYKGNSKCVLTPENEEQLSNILRHCYQHNLCIVPQSGNTGLAGGSVPVFDEIIISMKKFNQNFDLDVQSGILKCDAGFILEDLDTKLAAHNLMMPLDISSKGSCLIGGNVATNAGGIRLIRYGSLHNSVLGIKVALPDKNGSIVEFGSGLRKDNSNLHTKNLFIGSEGQFGIITQIIMAVPNRPQSVNTLFLGVKTFEKCCEILQLAKKNFQEILSSFEFMDLETINCVEEYIPVKNPLTKKCSFNLLIETSGSSKVFDLKKVENFFTECTNFKLIEDGILASNATESAELWHLRDNAMIGLCFDGYVYKYDFSLRIQDFYELVNLLRIQLKSNALVRRIAGFGHLGDGNIHLNVTSKKYSDEIKQILEPFIFDWVIKHGGSISAEHGIGRLKCAEYKRVLSPKMLEINNQLKKVFDPKKLILPYKFINT